ncbi:MAG: ribonuclease P protein component [Clostridia bacterium]|nr:ribonuclease P protein component [Clostridia bacterium]
MRYESLRRSSEFRRAFREGRSVAGDYVVVHAVPNGLSTVRTGFPVTKKLGGAVVRNRVRRLLREAVRLAEGIPSSGYDMVIIPRRRTAGPDVKCPEVAFDLERVLCRLALKEPLYQGPAEQDPAPEGDVKR